MAIKKKAVKSAKKTTPAKKAAPAKKAGSKPAHSSGGSKTAKKAPAAHAKGNAKQVAKKLAPQKKSTHPMPSKKPATSKPVQASAKSVQSHAKPGAGHAKPAVAHATTAKTVSAGTPKQPMLKHPHAQAVAAKHAPVAGAVKPVPKEEPKKALVKMPEPVAPVAIQPQPKKIIPPAKPTKVVIPEMKTKTVRKYEPEFTKSVLDTPQEEQTGPTMRYSDAELGEFRDLINRKLDAAKKELAYLQGLITRKDEMGGDNDDARYMTMEDGSMSMEREQLSQMASRQITFIDHLEKAIMRIENKTYGICRVTGKLIDKARLRAVPHATLSIEAKQMMNK